MKKPMDSASAIKRAVDTAVKARHLRLERVAREVTREVALALREAGVVLSDHTGHDSSPAWDLACDRIVNRIANRASLATLPHPDRWLP